MEMEFSTDAIINITSLIESHRKTTPDCEQKVATIGFSKKKKGKNNWYKAIQKALIRNKEENEMGVCIFRVPDHIAVVKPEAYIPQLIGLGPYHHCQPEQYEMEDYKLAAVKRAIAWFGEDHRQVQEFNEIVAKIRNLPCSSMCDAYRGLEHPDHKFLAWIMAIDGLFLFDYLLIQTNKGEIPTPTPTPAQPDPHAILKDVLKLENQIPMTVFKAINSKVMEKKNRPDVDSKKLALQLRGMLVTFCNDVSPIDLDWEYSLPRNLAKSLDLPHFLDLLYHYITYNDNPNPNPNMTPDQPKAMAKAKAEAVTNSDPNGDSFSKFLKKLATDYPKVGKLVNHLQDLFSSILFFVPVSSLASWKEKKVLIPSVSELHAAGVKFEPIEHGGTQKVEFHSETKTFRLPVVILKPTTEVVLRNLVAYETMAKSKSSNFKRYTELMSAIVDTVEDVKLLMDADVLVFRKKDVVISNDGAQAASISKGNNKECLSEVEIADMFNGMTKTIESKDRVIDEAIKKANKCYNDTRKVKAYRTMRKYVYSSWKMLTLFASLLLLLLTALQTFCDLYDCPAIFNNQGQGNMINSNWSVV
ncbi:hypothetical protein CCACVL1_08459 [Corchorus capsularis]|uniref:Uncharacterized protein n=1 Tax=Corchorus capsularis TaxID=210143 RepID=A0A1R3J0M4_COCAP|nr:hypothetical protein CCACVL1_08459 [Corchorus capsularis]